MSVIAKNIVVVQTNYDGIFVVLTTKTILKNNSTF